MIQLEYPIIFPLLQVCDFSFRIQMQFKLGVTATRANSRRIHISYNFHIYRGSSQNKQYFEYIVVQHVYEW